MRLSPARVIVVVALILTAYLIQSALLARMGLPGAAPDLVLVTVIGLAMAVGPTAGTAIGFASGVLIGLAPPGAGPLGQTAAVYAVIGFISGHLTLAPGRTPRSVAVAVAGLCAASVVSMAVLGLMLGSHVISAPHVLWLTVTTAVYGFVLAYVALPAVGYLLCGAVDQGAWA
ncbi:MAG: rod shape-determining protein MreD [Candidatus Nanopelagicales bacterium]|nr:rod shape-determining protein MreD [Candidatus Nanopelagicales bacterium]